MIASWSLAFIFIKTRKTAGTSAEIVLSSWCSGRDICSPITPEDERTRTVFGGAARNCGPPAAPTFYNHMPAAEIRDRLPDLWPHAFKFAVERHPYEKVVSLAWFQLGQPGGKPGRSIAEEIDRVIDQKLYLNHPLYCIEGRVAVDELIEYADLWTRLRALGDRVGRDLPATLPTAKARFRKESRPAHEALSPEQKRRIRHDARLEFELMGYDP